MLNILGEKREKKSKLPLEEKNRLQFDFDLKNRISLIACIVEA